MPQQLFFSTPEQRVALARERFFEQGDHPGGLVQEAVLQSWGRCLSRGQEPGRKPATDLVSRTRLHSALRTSRQLREAAASGLARLEAALAGTPCRVILTCPEGIVVHSSAYAAQARDSLLPLLSQVGSDLSENQLGTNALAIVARTGKGCTVQGSEHFSGAAAVLHCAAAPIRNRLGQLAGVLDITAEGRGFGFDASALVNLYASAIENRLLELQSDDLLVLAFQADVGLLGSPLAALAGVRGDGTLAWANGMARRLAPAAAAEGTLVDSAFGCTLESLLALSARPDAQPLRLPSGLAVWARAHLRQGGQAIPSGLLVPAPVPLPEPPSVAAPTAAEAAETTGPAPDAESAAPAPAEPASLSHQRAELVLRTLQDCHGNVARAARQLGVSRGLIYRTLKAGSAAQ